MQTHASNFLTNAPYISSVDVPGFIGFSFLFFCSELWKKWLGGELLCALNPKLSENIKNTYNSCDFKAFLHCFFGPPVVPLHLLDIPFVAKQYLAKTLLTSRDCICCKATTAYLKILKSGEGGSGWDNNSLLLLTVSGRVGQAAMWVCISVFCTSVYSTSISSSYNVFSISILCYVHLSWWQWCL